IADAHLSGSARRIIMRGPAGGVAPILALSSRPIRLISRAMCKARFIARASLRRWQDGTATGWATPIQAFAPNEAPQGGGLAACATPSRQRVIRGHWPGVGRDLDAGTAALVDQRDELVGVDVDWHLGAGRCARQAVVDAVLVDVAGDRHQVGE